MVAVRIRVPSHRQSSTCNFIDLPGQLTAAEKPIVKALFAKRWRNQGIQALVNMGCGATIKSARVTETENDATIIDAAYDAVERMRGKGVLRSKAVGPVSTRVHPCR